MYDALKRVLFNKRSLIKQYLLSITFVCGVAIVGLTLHGLMGFRVVAFMLLVPVSILAMTEEMYGLEAANIEVEKVPIQVGPTSKVRIKRGA